MAQRLTQRRLALPMSEPVNPVSQEKGQQRLREVLETLAQLPEPAFNLAGYPNRKAEIERRYEPKNSNAV